MGLFYERGGPVAWAACIVPHLVLQVLLRALPRSDGLDPLDGREMLTSGLVDTHGQISTTFTG